MEHKAFISYLTHGVIVEKLDNESAGILYKALFHYTRTREEYSGDNPAVQVAFGFMKEQIDVDMGKYEKKVERLKTNASKGGSSGKGLAKPRKKQIANRTDIEPISGGNPPDVAPKKPKEKPKYIPEFSDVFQKQYEDWIENRRQAKKPLTEKAIELQLADCRQWGEAKALESIKTSIKRQWQGLFEPKSDPKDSKKYRDKNRDDFAF